jgi:hypothetical protein
MSCGHSSCNGDHLHQDDTPEMGIEYSLFSRIDKNNLTCLNERRDGSGKEIFKPWEERLNMNTVVESDVDEELLFNIPFNGNIKLKGIILVAPEDDSHPHRMRLFKNQPNMCFDDVRAEALQEYELHRDPSGLLEYPTKVTSFSSVSHLTIHFPTNFGNDVTQLCYIGLRGEWTPAQRQEIQIANYELRPNLADHPNRIWDQVSREVQ